MYAVREYRLDEDNEPIGLFDQITLNLKSLKAKIHKIEDRLSNKFVVCPSYDFFLDKYFDTIEKIDYIINKLITLNEEINEQFFIKLIDDVFRVQESFEALIDINRKLQSEYKEFIDNDINTINGDMLVTNITQARKAIFGLINQARRAGNGNYIPRLIYSSQSQASDTIINDSLFQDTSLSNPSTISDNPPTVLESSPNINSTFEASNKSHIGIASTRRRVIQQLAFGPQGELLPNHIIAKKRDAIMRQLGTSANIFDADNNKASNEPTGDFEITDGRIIKNIIERAKKERDGAMIQSIKNNLVKNASNDEIYDTGLERSVLLADHIKNIGPSNPITLDTIEFGRISIISSETIEYGDLTCYKAVIILNNGQRVTQLLSANAFAVGDLSNKIIGEYDANNKLRIINIPCTIRRIRSKSIAQEPIKSKLFQGVGSQIKTGINKFMNKFSFGKNKS